MAELPVEAVRPPVPHDVHAPLPAADLYVLTGHATHTPPDRYCPAVQTGGGTARRMQGQLPKSKDEYHSVAIENTKSAWYPKQDSNSDVTTFLV